MSLIVNNVLRGSLNVNFEYFDSDEAFFYNVVGTYTVDVSDISFANGEGAILSGREALKDAYLQKNITARIGADEYVEGRITSLSFGEGSLVGSEQASITIEESKRLEDYANHTFAEYIPNPHLLESFDEDYDFSRDGDQYSYQRNLSIKYKQSTEAGDEFVHNLKVFASNYYHVGRPNLGYQTDGISENARFGANHDSILSENLDLINLSYSLSESFESSFIASGDTVSKSFTQAENLDAMGYLNKQIEVELVALRRDRDNVLTEAAEDTITQILAEEQAQFGSPVSIQKSFSRHGKKAKLSVSFSTNPTTSRDNTVTYTCSKQKSGEFEEYTVAATYTSKGVNNQQRIQSARDFWYSDVSNFAARVVSFFSDAGSVYEKTKTTALNYAQGSITDTVVFTDDDSYENDLPEGILKYQVTINRTNAVKRITRVADIETLKEKLTVSDNNTLVQVTITAMCVSIPSYGKFHGKNFLNSKTTELNNLLNASEYYIVNDQNTIDLANGTTNRVINYVIPEA
jgi:hypothetical protein